MDRQLEVLVTSGGTISKIDDVRHIGNFSGGMTGALIAEEFLRQGWKVHYVYGKNAKRPFTRSLNVNPEKPFEEESKRIGLVYGEFHKYKESLIERPIVTFEDYYNAVHDTLTNEPIDTVVLAAAVGDYSAETREGKISSDRDELVVKMKRNPKIISMIKQWKPDVYQIGFKLLSGVEDWELVQTGFEHCKKNRSDLVVANNLPGVNNPKSTTYILTSRGVKYILERRDLPQRLYEVMSIDPRFRSLLQT